jgi:membrane associated rhomboid family serine protease
MLNLTPLIFFIGLLPVVPAWAVAGEFFVVNLMQALGPAAEEAMGGVAVFAHLGGFVAGLFITRPLLAGRSIGARRWQGFRPPHAGAPGVARWRRRPRRAADQEVEKTGRFN